MFSIKTHADINVRGLTDVPLLCITMGIDFIDLSKNKAHEDSHLITYAGAERSARI